LFPARLLLPVSVLSLAECGNGDDLQAFADRHADDDKSFLQELQRERQLTIQASTEEVRWQYSDDASESDESIPVDSGESTSFEDSMMRVTASSSSGDRSPAKRGLGEGPEDGQELTDAQVAEALQAEEVCMHAPYMYISHNSNNTCAAQSALYSVVLHS
jgi:hypothetical protein